MREEGWTMRFSTLAGPSCALIAILAVASGWTGRSPARATEPEIAIRLFQFRPGRLPVAPGAHVTWTNQDDIQHTVTAGTPEQRDGRFRVVLDGKGASSSVRFREPGVYPYFCERHQHMRGEIRVD